MTNQTQTRTCIACGLKKPLMSFLELAGAEGRTYGNICADCRQAGAGKKSMIEADPGDQSGGTTRFQLDHKARMQTEQEKVDQFKHRTDLEGQEKSKKDSEAQEKTTKSELLEKTEKKHREEYLAAKQEEPDTAPKTALDNKQRTASSFQDRQKVLHKTFAQEKNWADRSQAVENSQNLQETNKLEIKKTAADVSVISVDEQYLTIGRSDESVFGRLRTYLGKSAAMNRTLEQYGKKTEQTTTAKKPPSFLQQATAVKKTTQEKKPADTAEKNIASEFVTNNMKRPGKS